MLKYLSKRIGRSILTLFVIVTLVFCLLRLMPVEGYFANYEKMTEAQIQAGLQSMGLLDPLPVQIGRFWWNALHGDLGISHIYKVNASVTGILAKKLPISIQMGVFAMLLSLVIGIPMGLLMGRFKNHWPDKIGTAIIVLIQAVPAAVYYLYIQMYGTTALGVGLLLGVWQLASLCFSPLVLPPVPQVAGTLAWLIREPDFWPTVGTTLLRLALGLGIGIAVGSILGLLFGLCPKLEDVGAPFIHVLQSVPPVCWVVLALVWFGFNGWPCVFIVAASTIPTVVINLSHGVRGVDPELLEMARLYRFSRRKVLLHVTLPSIRPYFLSALEIVVGGGWKLAVMGEVLTTNSGIGGAITTARLNIQPDAIIAWAFLLVAGCFITQKLVCLLLSRRGGAPC